LPLARTSRWDQDTILALRDCVRFQV